MDDGNPWLESHTCLKARVSREPSVFASLSPKAYCRPTSGTARPLKESRRATQAPPLTQGVTCEHFPCCRRGQLRAQRPEPDFAPRFEAPDFAGAPVPLAGVSARAGGTSDL